MKSILVLLASLCALPSFAAVNEAEYHQVLDKIYQIYQTDVEAEGLAFTINRDWDSEVVNAHARKWDDRFIMTIQGGIARHERTSPDSLAVIACHEMGFLFGGNPRGPNWASVIGQADYYATADCMKKYLADEDNVAFVSDKSIPTRVTTLCSEVYSEVENQALCARSTLAGIELGNLLADLNGISVDISTPSNEVADRTRQNHPEVQCRLDTFFAGALCQLSDGSNACSEGSLGARPACWFVDEA